MKKLKSVLYIFILVCSNCSHPTKLQNKSMFALFKEIDVNKTIFNSTLYRLGSILMVIGSWKLVEPISYSDYFQNDFLNVNTTNDLELFSFQALRNHFGDNLRNHTPILFLNGAKLANWKHIENLNSNELLKRYGDQSLKVIEDYNQVVYTNRFHRFKN